MKKEKLFFIALLCSLFAIAAPAQTLDEIVAKHIEAIGGLENWKKIKSMRSEFVMKFQGAEIKISTVRVDKKASRQDISVMGMTGYKIVKNTEGWNFMPWMGHTKPEALTTDDIKNSQEDLQILDEFITYKELGKQLDFYGTDDVDGTDCFKLKMTDKNGKETTFYIDPSNYFVIKTTRKSVANGQENETSTFYSDYKKLDAGIFYPMTTSGEQGELEITKIDINPPVDESIFNISK